MKSEIRGLKAGSYSSKDETLLLRVSKTDSGVLIEIADTEADTFYAVTVDEKSKAKFEWGNIIPTSIEENKGDNDGES